MNEINREDVRKQVVNMLADLKDLAALYMENNRKVAEMEGNAAYSREYKDAEIQKIREQLEEKVSGTFENLREHFESMVEIMRENDQAEQDLHSAGYMPNKRHVSDQIPDKAAAWSVIRYNRFHLSLR